MALNSLGLGIVISARDEASRVFARVNRAFVHLDGQSDAFVRKMRTNGMHMAAGLGGVTAGVIGLGAAFAAAQVASKYETAMSHLRVASKATVEEMEVFRKATITASQASMYGPVEMAQTLKNFAAQGYSAADSMKLLTPALDLATASMGEIGLEEAAGITGQVLRGWSIHVDDAAATLDKLTNAALRFSSSPKDIKGAVSGMAAGALLLKQDLTTSLVAFGLVKNVLARTELSANAVKVSMIRLASGAGAKTVKKLGVNTWDEKKNKFKNYFDILFEIQSKLDAMHGSKAADITEKIFGTRASGAAQVAMEQLKKGVMDASGKWYYGLDAVKQLKKEVEQTGTTASMAAAELATYGGQMKLMNANAERLKIQLGEGFKDAFRPVLALINKVIIAVTNALEKMPASTKKTLAQFFLLGAALTTVFGALLAGKALMALFGVTLGGIAAAAASLVVPLLAIGAAIGVAIMMFKAFEVHAENAGGGVLGFFTDIAKKVSLAFRGLMQLFTEGAFSGDVMLELNKAENKGVKSFAIKIFLWVERIKNFLKGMWDGFKEGIKELTPTFDRLVEVLGFVSTAFGLSVGPANDNKTAWESAGSSGRTLGETLSRLAGTIANVLTIGLLIGVGAVELFKAAWQGVGPVVSGAAYTIWGAVQMIVGVLSGDWAMAWKGAVNVTYGLIEGLIGIIAWLARAVLGVIDGLNKVLGIDSTLLKDFNWGMEEIVYKGLAASKAKDMAAYDKPGPAASATGAGWSNFSSSVIPSPNGQNSPAIAAKNAFVGPIQQPPAGPPPPQTINLTSITKWDEQTLAKLQQHIKTAADARGFIVGAHP